MDDRQGEIAIGRESDVIVVRQTVRKITKTLEMGLTDTTRLVTAASELTRNIFLYAGSGVMRWQIVGSIVIEALNWYLLIRDRHCGYWTSNAGGVYDE